MIEYRLLELMGRQNIRSIEELHKKTGISRTVISEIINGKKTNVRADTIARLCKALDCNIEELVVLKTKVG